MSLKELDMLFLDFFSFSIYREESVLEQIQPNELHEKMQNPSFLEEAQLIDVREPDEVYVHDFLSFYL